MGGGWTGRINNMEKLMNKNIDLDYDLEDLVRMMKAETWSRRWILTLDNNVLSGIIYTPMPVAKWTTDGFKELG